MNKFTRKIRLPDGMNQNAITSVLLFVDRDLILFPQK